MGHYEEQFNQYDKKIEAQNLRTTKAEFKKAAEKLLKKENINDLRFVINVINNIKDMKAFFRILEKL
jgi:hypothetical protein